MSSETPQNDPRTPPPGLSWDLPYLDGDDVRRWLGWTESTFDRLLVPFSFVQSFRSGDGTTRYRVRTASFLAWLDLGRPLHRSTRTTRNDPERDPDT